MCHFVTYMGLPFSSAFPGSGVLLGYQFQTLLCRERFGVRSFRYLIILRVVFYVRSESAVNHLYVMFGKGRDMFVGLLSAVLFQYGGRLFQCYRVRVV